MTPKTDDESNQRGLILITLLLLVLFLVWAHLTKLDLVTHGQGRVVPRGQNFSVQVPQSGTIVRFEAQAGDRVEENQIIAEINPTDATGSLAEAESKLKTLTLRLARLDAEMTGTAIQLDEKQARSPFEQSLLQAEIASSDARKADLGAKEAALFQAKLQKERNLQALIAELDGTDAQLTLLADEAAQILPMVTAGVLGSDEKFRIEREDQDAKTRISILAEQIESTRFGIAETDAQIIAAQATFRRQILEERVDVLSQLAELTERMPALRLRVTQTEIRAPVTGILNQVSFNRRGAVVSEGEIVAEIVPDTSELRVETLIAPEDIANVEPGQRVRIALTAYDATKFGTLSGEVVRVSADATMRDEVQARMFVVETTITGSIEDVDGSKVKILPGMIAQVDVIRGYRSILEYFWNPVIKVKDRAFRE